jgi:hypothetical protein
VLTLAVTTGIVAWMVTKRWVGLVFGLSLLGCTSTESRCETLCKWANQCGDIAVDCSNDAEIDECVEEYDDLDADCQDAFDDLVDCVDEENLTCSAVEEHCLGEAGEYVEQCGS